MNAKRWQQIEDIFQAALDLAPSERARFIEEKSGDDAELRGAVEKYIAGYEREETFLESPVWTDSRVLQSQARREIAASLDEEISPLREEKSYIGVRVGVFRLTEEIGRGGMGVVYRAERADGEFQQKAAVKLIKRGMDTDFIVRRFRRERQILADLNHPNIARLLDGGTTADGLPYFVMEYIKGEPFLKFCERKNLDLRRKLELFLEVCAPVIYAHKRKIIHRDLKPSNILVTDEGEPKLLDFGIAKILETDSVHDSHIPTATAMRLMTPEYASPEQVRGEEITTASDQYSLGVLLYELLTGERPYKFPSRSAHEIARVICESSPSSLVLSPSFVESSSSFGNQRTKDERQRTKNEMLDRIALKTLRKKPSERYDSVADFAADIERFLRNEIVRAETFDLSEKEAPTLPLTVAHRFIGEPDSARRKGIKQGIFLIILFIVGIPFFNIVIQAGIISPPLMTTIFLLVFLGGIARVLYALLLEDAAIKAIPPKQNQAAETELIKDSSPRQTSDLNRITAEKTDEDSEKTEKSIAVLPFKNLNMPSSETTGGNSEFLSVGLADALISRLSNVRQLLVRPTGSILRFADADAFQAGEELKVEYVLSGNILPAEKKIRVSVQLLDVRKKATIWAQRFDEDFTDVLDIEDSISARVADSLTPHLTGAEREKLKKRGTDSPEAYEAYLRGRAAWNAFSEDGFRRAVAYYREAIEIDPNYAAAHAAIADYYVWLGMYSLLPVEQFYPPSKRAARRAIELDSRSSEAHAALGLAELYGKYDWRASEKNMRRAVELNPNNATAHLWLTHNLYTLGKFAEGGEHLRRAVELDPLSFQNHNTLAWGLYFERRLPEAIAKADDLIKNFPASSHAYFAKSAFLRFAGRAEESLAVSRKSLEFSDDAPFASYGHAAALAAAGRRAEALEIIENPAPSAYLSDYHTAIVRCWLKEKDEAFAALDKAVAARESTLVWLAIEPSLDYLRGEARFQKLLEKINHPRRGGNQGSR